MILFSCWKLCRLMLSVTDLIRPQWTLPAGVRACISTRQGGCSGAPWDSNNLGLHVGDDAGHVQHNRRELLLNLPGANAIQWLDQIHGAAVTEACGGQVLLTADAQFSRRTGLACAVLTADCLPVLFCAADGSQVAAAHAGWRGLAGGVLLNTLQTFADPAAVMVFLGPAIGPSAFEVGPEVRAAFPRATAGCFRPGDGDRWYGDLYQLAREQLQAAGVRDIQGGNFCTFSEKERFYSYRRDGCTGRMASLIWRCR